MLNVASSAIQGPRLLRESDESGASVRVDEPALGDPRGPRDRAREPAELVARLEQAAASCGARRGLAVAALLGALAVPLLTRGLAADEYWIQVLIWVMFFAYLGAAWNLIGGFAGQYSIGHAGMVGIGAYTSSLLMIHVGLTPWIGMLAGGLLAAAFGGLIGYPCFRLRGAFFSLVTIAFAEMLRVGLELTDRIGSSRWAPSRLDLPRGTRENGVVPHSFAATGLPIRQSADSHDPWENPAHGDVDPERQCRFAERVGCRAAQPEAACAGR